MNGRIDSRLAAQIVEQAARVLPFDVNVMDAKGSVLASTDPSRVSTFHSGAHMALASGRAVEVDSATASQVPHIRPGINLPLVVRGETVGVVGVTGAPDEVRQFGKLLQSMAQMILERDELMLELRRDERHKEEFVRQAINRDNALPLDDLRAWADRLDINVARARCAIMCRFEFDSAVHDAGLSDLDQVQAVVAQERPDFLLARVSLGELAVFGEVEIHAAEPQRTGREARKLLNELQAIVASVSPRPFLLALGIGLPGIDGLQQSWKCASATMRVGLTRRRGSDDCCFSYYECSLPVLLSGLAESWQIGELLMPLRRLLAKERGRSTLLDTLNVWYEQGGHPTRTSEALGIHRNTLDYRLRKINDATGLNVYSVEDFVLLYIALQLGLD